jgi:hypothetical protein
VSSLRVRIPEDLFATLERTLAMAEEVAFLYARWTGNAFEVDAIEVMDGTDIASRSGLHVSLADDVRPRVIKTAWDRDRCLIEAHSHGRWGYAEFSRSDLHGFEEWVGHVRWRLRGRPYAALVKADDQWDALVWADDAKPGAISAIEITNAGRTMKTVLPTNTTATQLAAGGRHD